MLSCPMPKKTTCLTPVQYLSVQLGTGKCHGQIGSGRTPRFGGRAAENEMPTRKCAWKTNIAQSAQALKLMDMLCMEKVYKDYIASFYLSEARKERRFSSP